jgi:CheY-like chemotaxis protein
MKTGPIIFVDDQIDDWIIIKEIFSELRIKNEALFFETSREVLSYLESTTDEPFLILCDVFMPGLNGLELCKVIQDSKFLKDKKIPFIFFSTTAEDNELNEAYNLNVQGFFKKPNTYEEIKSFLIQIIAYWSTCRFPKISANTVIDYKWL